MEVHSTLSGNHAIASYARFGLMVVLSFVAMYVLMYAMVNTLATAIQNYRAPRTIPLSGRLVSGRASVRAEVRPGAGRFSTPRAAARLI